MDVRIRDWTFTHWWVRPVVKVWFHIYHKSVTYSGTERLEWDKPLIFAPSHQNAFSDALCLILPAQYTNNHFIYPLIRADAFGSNRALDWILTAFHMLPVYRPRDEVDLKRKNRSVFSSCFKILEQKRNLLIHPEGHCIARKNVCRFKKGLARIALGAEEKNEFNLGVHIIPVGINYREITKPRKGIHIRYGSPIKVSDYAEAYLQHEASGIAKLTDDVEDGVRKVTVDIDYSDSDFYYFTEDFIRAVGWLKNNLDNDVGYTAKELAVQKKMVKQITGLYHDNPEHFKTIRQLHKRFKKKLKQNGLDPDTPLISEISWPRLLLEGSGYLLYVPIVLYSWLNNFLPWFIMDKLAARVKEKQFKSSARMTVGLLLFPFFYTVQTIIIFGITENWFWSAAYLISLPLAGVFSLNYREGFTRWLSQFRFKRMAASRKEKVFRIIDRISSLLEI